MKRESMLLKKGWVYLLVSTGYGSFICCIGLMTGYMALSGIVAGSVAMALNGACFRVMDKFTSCLLQVLVATFVWACNLDLAMALFFPNRAMLLNMLLTIILTTVLSLAFSMVLSKIARSKNITSDQLIDKHIDLLKDLFQKFCLFIQNNSNVQISESHHGRKRSWDVQLVLSFAHELAAVFPEVWNEWQHWISDMMEDRTRMQSKGMNYRLVSLITFYRFTRFVCHIGIDKVFILATRRATR